MRTTWTGASPDLRSAIARSGRVGVFGTAVAIGVASLLLLLLEASTLVHSFYLSSDSVSGFVLPLLAGHAPAGATVNLGNHASYEPYLFMRATAGLPHYRQIWEAAPFFFAFLGIASVAACAWWALGSWAALVTAVTLTSVSDPLRSVIFVPDTRVALILHMGIFCGALLWAHERARSGRPFWWPALAIGAPLVVFSGFGMTDQLLIFAGLAPFVAAPLLCWWRWRTTEWRRLATFGLATGLLALLAGHLVTRTMESDRVVHGPFPVKFVSTTAIATGVENTIGEFLALGGGSFFGQPASGGYLFVLATGVLVLVALGAVLRAVWRWGAEAVARRAVEDERPRRELFVAYWGTALVLVLLSFASTSVSEIPTNFRYLLGAWVAAAALLGVFVTARGPRIAVVLGVCLFGLLTIRTHLSERMPAYGIGPDQKTAGMIEHFALAHDAKIGYTGYWQASPITWETNLRVKVFPIFPCGTPPSGWCPSLILQISSWYTPRKHTRSFLLTQTPAPDPGAITAPVQAFGRPIAQVAFGPYAVYVYDHDLADAL